MALFGKKKQAEPTAPQLNPEEDVQFVGETADDADFDDANASDGPVIDFDAIAQDLNAHEEGADMDSFLGKTGAQNTGDFATSPNFESGETNDEELDFDSTFDDGSLAATAPVTTGEDPFGNAPDSEPAYPEPALTTEAPPLTHTAPILTSDMAAGGAPAVRRSPPLLPLLGAAGLLVALGVVGYTVMGRNSAPEESAPVVAANPPLQASGDIVPVNSDSGPSLQGAASGVNPGIAVDGVPIAPGPVVVTGGLPPTVPLTPALQNQLKSLWNKGAAAKRAGDIAGARAAWMQMLQLRPNHPGIQSAIDKLPAG